MLSVLLNLIFNVIISTALPIHFTNVVENDNNNKDNYNYYNNNILYRIILYIISLIISVFIFIGFALLIVLYFNKFMK
jgi:hypothetical protein